MSLCLVALTSCGDDSAPSGNPGSGGAGMNGGVAGSQVGGSGGAGNGAMGGTRAGSAGSGAGADDGGGGTSGTDSRGGEGGSDAPGGDGGMSGTDSPGGTGGEGGSVAPCVDADGDGYGDGGCRGPDCNDSDPSKHPGAADTPADGVDQDCDGFERCYGDFDGDGDIGEINSSDLDCTDPHELAAPSGEFDCDDHDPWLFTTVQAYVDEDADGFGAGSLVSACQGAILPVGYSLVVGDCNDDDPTTWPGAGDEPGDGVDQDCNGADPPLDESSAVFVDAACTGTCGAGTRASPATTIADALTLARRSQVLVVAEGTYAGDFTTIRSIYGGYQRGTWARDIARRVTNISEAGAYVEYVLSVGLASAVTLSGLHIEFPKAGRKAGIFVALDASLVLDRTAVDISTPTTDGPWTHGIVTNGARLVISRSSVVAGPVQTGFSSRTSSAVSVFEGGVVAIRDSEIENGGAESGQTVYLGQPQGGFLRASIERSTLRCATSDTFSAVVATGTTGWVTDDRGRQSPVVSQRFRSNEFFQGPCWDLNAGVVHLDFIGNRVHDGGISIGSGTVANNVFEDAGGLTVQKSVKVLHNLFHSITLRGMGVYGTARVVVVNNLFNNISMPVWLPDDPPDAGNVRVIAFGNDFWGAGTCFIDAGAYGCSATPAELDACDWLACFGAGGTLSVAPALATDIVHLTPSSPLRDAGVVASGWDPRGYLTTDIDGDARIGPPDVGADEIPSRL